MAKKPISKPHRDMLIEQLRQRTAKLLALLDKVEAGEEYDPVDGVYLCGDVETAARFLRKGFRRQK